MDHPLRRELSAAVKELRPSWPSLSGWERASAREVFACGRWEVAFNETTGAIAYLRDAKTRQLWATEGYELAELVYQTFTDYDHNHVFMHEYMSDSMYDPTLGAPLNHDFGKPGLGSCRECEHLDVRPELVALWRNGCSFRAQLRMPGAAHRDYGAPAEAWLRVDVPNDGARIAVTLDLFNKTATRIPESTSVRFVPAPVARLTPKVSKLGSWIDPATVVLNGSRHLHGLDDLGGVGLFGSSGLEARFVAVDSSTACVGRYPTPYPVPLDRAMDPAAGFSFNVHNNIWNTNYILWYPYLEEDKDIRQRFVLDLDAQYATAALPWQREVHGSEAVWV